MVIIQKCLEIRNNNDLDSDNGMEYAGDNSLDSLEIKN